MPPEIRKFLYDIQSACQALEQFIDGITLDDYQADLLLRSGVERQLTIIGEALNQALRVDPTLAEKVSSIRQIINFRNVAGTVIPLLRMRPFGVFCKMTCPSSTTKSAHCSAKKPTGLSFYSD